VLIYRPQPTIDDSGSEPHIILATDPQRPTIFVSSFTNEDLSCFIYLFIYLLANARKK